MSWRHRFLWLLAVFAGSGGGGRCSFSVPSGNFGQFGGAGSNGFGRATPEVLRALAEPERWIGEHLGLLLAIGGLVLLLVLLLLTISFLCQGSLARATLDL